MPLTREAQTHFVQDGSKASLVACPANGSITIYSTGNTLYYDNASTVTSSSNDGNIASGASATFTTSQYIITAQGVSTNVFVYTPESLSAPRGEVQASNYLSGSGGPVSGTSAVGGTGAGSVGAGALYVNEANGATYVNEGTTASPYWTPASFESGVLGVYEDWRGLPSAILGGNVPAITDTGTVGWTPAGARVGGLGLAEADSGVAQGTNVEGSQVARVTATDEDAKGVFLGGPSVAQFQPDTNSPLVVDVELTAVSAITTRSLFVGFIGVLADNAAPQVVGATTTATFTPDNIAGIFQDTGFTDADGLMLVSEKANTAGTQVSLTAAAAFPAAATYTRLRVEVQADGSVTAFKDKVLLGEIPGATGAGTHAAGTVALPADEELIPAVFLGSKTTATSSWDVKRFGYWGTRP